MGMFDSYDPGPLTCPLDGAPLTDWQGKDGPCVLDSYSLYDVVPGVGPFEMHTSHGEVGSMHFVEAFGFTVEASANMGVWIASAVVSVWSSAGMGEWPTDLWNIGDGHGVKVRRGGVTITSERKEGAEV
jgi:hypothetical protein